MKLKFDSPLQKQAVSAFMKHTFTKQKPTHVN